jgi:hypothetical protein
MYLSYLIWIAWDFAQSAYLVWCGSFVGDDAHIVPLFQFYTDLEHGAM